MPEAEFVPMPQPTKVGKTQFGTTGTALSIGKGGMSLVTLVVILVALVLVWKLVLKK